MKAYDFGSINGQGVTRFRMEHPSGVHADVLDMGCTIHSLSMPDGGGKLRDMVQGLASPEAYRASGSHMGAVCGRFANRIAGARFSLGDEEHRLIANDGANCLHGGTDEFSYSVWHAETEGERLRFSLVSPCGAGGFPGELAITVLYELIDGPGLRITYEATATAPTVFSPTNHAYFALDDAADVSQTELFIGASSYIEVSPSLIPTGRILPVHGTAFDFSRAKALGAEMPPMGYDHCFALDGGGLRRAARARSPISGASLSVLTDRPGLQLYTANFLDEPMGKGGAHYRPRSSFCLETEAFPDAPNHENFPSAALLPGEAFHSVTAYMFGE